MKEEDIVGIKRELYIAPPTTCERRRAYSRYIVGIKQEQVKEEQGAPYAPSLPATALLPVLLLALLPTLQQVQVKAEHTAICSALPAPAPALYLLYTYYMLSSFRM